jgi:hypothetical protein
LDLFATRQIADRAGDLKYPNKDLLYVQHAFPEYVPVIPIRWEELTGIGA